MSAEPADVSYLLQMAHRFLRPEMLCGGRIVSAFAALRVLPRGEEALLGASRDHLLSVGAGGMVSVGGGKLTTHRRIALDALRCLPDRVRPRRLSLSDAPLPGASPVRDRYPNSLDGSALDHLMHLYGSETGKLLCYRKVHDNALERVTPGAPDLWAQVYHAFREEWALSAEDVIHRRTTLGLRGFDTPQIRHMISVILEYGSGASTSLPGLSKRSLRAAGTEFAM